MVVKGAGTGCARSTKRWSDGEHLVPLLSLSASRLKVQQSWPPTLEESDAQCRLLGATRLLQPDWREA